MSEHFNIILLNLIQHVELNKAGWWDEVINRLIYATLWMVAQNDPISCDDIDKHINENFGLNLGGKLKQAIKNLCEDGDLVQTSDGCIKISEIKIKEIDSEVNDVEQIINCAKNEFVGYLNNCDTSTNDHDVLWEDFNNSFLRPFIKNTGANIYDLLVKKSAIIDQSLLETFLADYPTQLRHCLREASQSFVLSKNQYVRSYILRSLNAYFCIEASGLDSKTLDTLNSSIDKPNDIYIFVDTNFLFSILELHENPSNEAAVGLLELVKKVEGKLNLKLYVLNQTLEEARSVLHNAIDTLNSTNLTPNMAEAGKQFLSGLSKKYFTEVSRSNTPMAPKDFFGPYIDNLLLIVRNKGVELFNEDISELKTRQDVINSIVDQMGYEEEKYSERAKSYKTLEHDIVLWHFIKDKREAIIESPLDAKYWIVTIDFRLLGYDAYKKSREEVQIPLCLHPTTLIQLLQFWVPRSPLLESTLYSSLWLPFVFQELDSQNENVTIQIIKSLGRFKNVGDLPEDSIVEILLNDALRLKIKNETDIDNRIELIREALIEQNKKIFEEAKHAKEKNIEFAKSLHQKEIILEKLLADLDNTRDELSSEQIARKNLSVQLTKLQNNIDQLKKTQRSEKTKRRFFILSIIFPLILLIIIQIICQLFIANNWLIIGTITVFYLGVWFKLLKHFGLKNSIISETKIFRSFLKLIDPFLWVLITITLSLIASLLYDLIKDLWLLK